MSIISDGYKLAMMQYKSIQSNRNLYIENGQNLSKVLESLSNKITTSESNSTTAVTTPTVNKADEAKFEEALQNATNAIQTSGNSITYQGYKITVPALEDKQVQSRIKAEGIDTIVKQAAEKYDLPEMLIYKVIETESYFNSSCVSSVGATGLMQIMPFNNESLGISDATDPYQNIMGGTKLLKQYIDMYDGDIKLGLAAYNAGPGNVNKYGGVPPFNETQNYIRKILGVEP